MSMNREDMPEGFKDFEEQMQEIVTNLKDVKGKAYVGAIMLYMNTLNVLKVTGPFARGSQELMERRRQILNTYLTDTIERLVDLLYPDATEEEVVAHMCEFAKNVDSVHIKQREFNDTMKKNRE